MEDGQGACSEAVEYRLTQEEEGSWILTVTADRTWMEAEDRVYPVAIDPTLIDQTKSTDFEGTVCTTGMNYVIKDEKVCLWVSRRLRTDGSLLPPESVPGYSGGTYAGAGLCRAVSE